MELEINNKKSAAGFTLVELLVAMATFSIIIVAMSGISVSVINAQRKAFVLQNTQESTRYLLESMSKEIRMSTINSSASNKTNILNITNDEGLTLNYQFDNVNKKLMRYGYAVSPSNIDLTGWFYIRKSNFPNRSLVTIIIKAESQGSRQEESAETSLQNSVSSRPF